MPCYIRSVSFFVVTTVDVRALKIIVVPVLMNDRAQDSLRSSNGAGSHARAFSSHHLINLVRNSERQQAALHYKTTNIGYNRWYFVIYSFCAAITTPTYTHHLQYYIDRSIGRSSIQRAYPKKRVFTPIPNIRTWVNYGTRHPPQRRYHEIRIDQR